MSNTLESTNAHIVSEYLTFIEFEQGLSPRSVRTYAETLHNYVSWLDDRPLSTIRPRDVQAFGRRPRPRTTNPSANTVRRDVVIVRQFHLWAAENDFEVRTVSTAVAPRVPKPHPKPVEDDVWRKLWGSELSDDDRLWLGLGYFCGLRRIEIVTIAPTEVNVARGVLDFERKGGSYFAMEYLDCIGAVDDALPHLTMGLKDRFIEILHSTAERRTLMGATYLWYDSEGHVENDGQRLNKRLDKRLLPKLGLPPHSVTPHRLRHSCATNLLRADCDPEFVRRQMSHSSPTMTERYSAVSGEMARWRQREKLLREGVMRMVGDG